MMIDVVDDWIRKTPIGEQLNLTNEMNKIVFRIITKILFGRDIDKMENWAFVSSKDNTVSNLSFEESFFRYGREEKEGHFLIRGRVIDLLREKSLIEPYKTNNRNKHEIDRKLKNFLKFSKDDQSVYKQLVSKNQFTEDKIYNDMMLLLFAGFESTSHAIASSIYFLHKNKRVMDKLMDELKWNGIANLNQSDNEESLKQHFEECDYLNYVTKETLRIDPPSFASLMYYAKENIKICGVSIEKGTNIYAQMMLSGINAEEWKEPLEFIPERFDPDSEYFFKPNSSKKEHRDPRIYIPFSLGIRNCPGQSLAKLELRVILSRILTSIDLEIDKDQLSNNYAKFNMFSQMSLKGKIVSNMKNE